MDELLVAADVEAMLIELGCEVVDSTVAEVEQFARPAVFSAAPGAAGAEYQRGSFVGLSEPSVVSAGRQLPILGKPYDRAELAALLRAACGLRDPT